MRGVLTTRFRAFGLLAIGFCAGIGAAHGEMGFLMEEPFGLFGKMNPTGHAAVYFSRICADSPTHLRRCSAGERGVVLSRYHEVAGYDWLAVPLIPYLYAVDRPDQIPDWASVADVARLREAYRRKALRSLIPDGADGATPDGEWIQLIGSSYDRRIYCFRLETTPEQDDRLIEMLNADPNRAHFNLFFRNCADYARRLIDADYPRLLHRGHFDDTGMTTPKQIAKTLAAYGRRHPELGLRCFVIPQIPGEAPRSTRIRGVFESLLLSKKYAAPLLLLKPALAATMAVGYVSAGRFDPRRHVTVPQSVEWAPSDVLAELRPAMPLEFRADFRSGILRECLAMVLAF